MAMCERCGQQQASDVTDDGYSMCEECFDKTDKEAFAEEFDDCYRDE